MNLLKKIPIRYIGELHDVMLVNFTVDKKEVEPLVPWNLVVRDFDGRAMISMVNVALRNMHPSFVPASLHFNYRHIGFRLLLSDAHWNNDYQHKGIFFLKSFTDRPLIVQGGRWITDYNLELAQIVATHDMLALKQGNRFVHYVLDEQPPVKNDKLQETIGGLDRAYSVEEGKVRMVQIQREKWPIEPVHCAYFNTNFFETARFEGAFRVNETIHYEWISPRTI